jgi:hypothetical protein
LAKLPIKGDLIKQNLTPKKINDIKKTFKDVRTLIIDEMGFLGQRNYYFLKMNLTKSLSPNELLEFGGLNLTVKYSPIISL